MNFPLNNSCPEFIDGKPKGYFDYTGICLVGRNYIYQVWTPDNRWILLPAGCGHLEYNVVAKRRSYGDNKGWYSRIEKQIERVYAQG
jgi:hypothetical protein